MPIERANLRYRLMSWWWGVWMGKPTWLQNGVGRVLCLVWGHEYTRSRWCDWCGKERRGMTAPRPPTPEERDIPS